MDSNSIINNEEKVEETTEIHTEKTVKPARNAAMSALAIVGFLVLIFIGIGLAIYSSQFVPSAVNHLASNTTTSNGSAPTGVIEPTVSPTNYPTSYSAQPATTTTATTVTMPQTTEIPASAIPTPATTTSSYSSQSYTTSTYAAAASAYPARPTLYGLPDLSTNIVSVGYLAAGPGSAFVPSPNVPDGDVAAVQFTIGNIGTNATGPWNFIAQIPTAATGQGPAYTYTSPTEENMNPGDHILFTLSFNQLEPGQSEPIQIIADPNDQLQEGSKSNNTADATLTVIPD